MNHYSGKTTSQNPADPKFWKIPAPPAIRQVTLFDVQWTDCPVEVEAEVQRLWREYELGNDTSYFSWDRTKDPSGGSLAERYPLIDEYLMSKGVSECLIHWWW